MAKKKAKKKTTRRTTKKRTTKRAAKKRTTKKRTTKKRTTKKRTTKAAAPRPSKLTAAKSPRTKSEIYNIIAERAGLSRKEVVSVFQGLEDILAVDLSKRGPGQVQVPGLMKVVVKRMPAKRARKGINPFTKEPTIFKAKPARNVVKVRPMIGLKRMV